MYHIYTFANYRFNFKAATFAFLITFLITSAGFSQDVVIYFVNGESEATPVEEIDKITIQGSWLKFDLANGQMLNYNLGSVIRYEFDFTSGITESTEKHLRDLIVFPNPAFQSVGISFTLHEATDVELRLLDVQGRHINALNGGVLPAGEHRMEISNPSSAAGYYLLQVITDSGVQVKPVLFTTTK